MNEDHNPIFKLVEARKQVFEKFPAELKALHVYKHFYTDLDEKASQLSLQWFALLISYFCSLCRLEGRRTQYTTNGFSERFGAEFAKAHQRASILFERVTMTYQKILMTYNMHSEIITRDKRSIRLIKEEYKMHSYTQGAKCDVDKEAYDRKPSFQYALDELRFYEELVNFTVEMLKKAFTDERLQTPIVNEVKLLFRSNSFSFQHIQRQAVVNKTRKTLEDAQGVDSVLHNCHRLAARLVPDPSAISLKLALRQRSPFVASQVNHPLLTMLSYQRAFARREVGGGSLFHAKKDLDGYETFHVRLREGEESPHIKELRELQQEKRDIAILSGCPKDQLPPKPKPVATVSTATLIAAEATTKKKTPLGQKKRPSSASPSGVASAAASQQQQTATTDNFETNKTNNNENKTAAAAGGARSRSTSPTSTNKKKKKKQSIFLERQPLSEPTAANSTEYWHRIGTTPEEETFTVEVNQPMFSPSHRALSSLTPITVLNARKQVEEMKTAKRARESELTKLPTSSILPKLHDYDRPDVEELPHHQNMHHHQHHRADSPIDHKTDILYGRRSSPLGRVAARTLSPAQQGKEKLSLGAKFSRAAKRIATATGIKTNVELQARSEQKAIDRLVSAAAATTPMSTRCRAILEQSQDPHQFFVAPLDPQSGKEDFLLYDPTDEVDAVYQQLAHGVQLSHFEVPLDIGCVFDATGLLVPNV